MSESRDEFWMKRCLRLARWAAARGEVPVGAVIIDENGKLLSVGLNNKEAATSALGHAEIMAVDRACRRKKAWRLSGCTLFVTLEPCAMCAGALIQARIQRVVFGVRDPRTGALVSLYQLGSDPRLNHQIMLTENICADLCSPQLKNFFKDLREQKKIK